MLLYSLTLENVRIFKGKNVIDFTPVRTSKSFKPIILVGGKNGAGKTTLFESFLLCLYAIEGSGKPDDQRKIRTVYPDNGSPQQKERTRICSLP